MFKKYINKHVLLAIAFFSSLNVLAQSSLQQVLSAVEKNNKTLKAAKQSANVRKIEAKTGIYPSDINVGYEFVRGNEITNYQREHELTVVQSFDFPTAYFQKNKIAGMQARQADAQYAILRRDVLLETKTLCIELVYLNKNKSIIDKKIENAGKLGELSQKRLEVGDANVLEANKIALELLNIRNEARINEAGITARLQKLSELNGGEPVAFTDTAYYETIIPATYADLLQKTIATNPELRQLEQEKEIASKSVGLTKSLSLPKWSFGYKMVISKPEKFHGFVAGVSIPLWENKNTVKSAKAKVVLTELQLDNLRASQSTGLKLLYDKTQSLKQMYEEYRRLLASQNSREHLDKAFASGKMSLHDYFGEINFLYEAAGSFLQTERDYHLAVAELLKAEL
jgi:outer membrane protein TolC